MTTHPKVLFAATVFAVTACSGGATGPASTPDTDPAAGGGTQVAIDDFAFRPETVTVPAGTTITWSNDDATAHTVTAGDEDEPDPDTFDLAVDEQGQTVAFTFDEAGTYAYYCELHPFMTGVVEVTG